ncbi:MAG: aspartate aminotransferase family protein [Sphingobacteriales bacterium]|nr:MAG: aspartate aminotransferase family protein [Sphingobacteriales bacterium]
MKKKFTPFPKNGMDKEALLNKLRSLKSQDARWKMGRAFAHIYNPGTDIAEIVREAYNLFYYENALNPYAFPSLKTMENEVISMAADLLGAPETATGTINSGGTESIFLAMQSAREWAKEHHPVTQTPEILIPVSAHPAFQKACHYLNLKPVFIPVGTDYRVDLSEAWKAISPNTIAIIGSAPSFPHGVIDNITKMARLALENNLWLHVDACVGGFILPFARKLGHVLPDFDFSIDGVCSLSADLHKYGYAAKGASILLYKNAELRKHQIFTTTQWPGGVYATIGFSGTRPGGTIASAYAAFNGIGESGYLKLTEKALQTIRRLRKGIEDIAGLELVAPPDITLMAITSSKYDIYAVADELTEKGWFINRQYHPPSIHLTVSPVHADIIEEFLLDLKAAAESAQKLSINRLSNSVQLMVVKGLKKLLPTNAFNKIQSLATNKANTDSQNSALVYGVLEEIAGNENLDNMIVDAIDELYTNSE